VHVPSGWQLPRQEPGHHAHAARELIAFEQCHPLASGKFDTPGPQPCAACHAKQARIQHASARSQAEFGAAAQADCTDCHAFAASGASPPPAAAALDAGSRDGAWDCGRCHDGHDSAPASGTAVVAHRTAACSACHTPHGDEPATPADCVSCHAAVTLVHGRVERSATGATVSVAPGAPESVRGRCRVCHEGLHDPAAQSVGGCVECHATTAPIVTRQALFAGGHERCTGCHAPHGFGQAGVVSCASCHGEQPPALASAKVKAHAACESCHRAHDARAEPSASCVGCHATLENDHPAPPSGAACTGCHVAHPPAASGGALHAASASVPCAECHPAAARDGGFHAQGVTCRECHVPHRFELAASDLGPCERCHSPEIGRTRVLGAGHGACQQCHAGLPHDADAEPRACASCHTLQADHVSPGHRACQSCHEPHAGELKAACASCHAPVLEGAPAGHRACQSCHEPHTGKPAVAGCTSCHAAKAKEPHHGVDGGCGSCHSPHGPAAKAPPPCSSCHAKSERPGGLHAVLQHERCSDCHRAHAKQPRPEPEACRSCHQDRAQHFPEARRCSGCHLFESL
jgi:hypothetical protein